MLRSLLSLSLAALATCQSIPFVASPLPRYSSIPKRGLIDFDQYPGEVIQMPVDHFNESDTRTYGNRFWVNATYYQPGGPVFFFAAGEQNAQFLVPHYLQEGIGPSSPVQLAKRFNGLAILFEHRYYGGVSSASNANGSYPVPVNASGIATDYSYLTLEQALEDVVYLAHNFQPAGLEDNWDALSSDKTPWIFIGASYPGAQAAIIRVRNPETIYASWASSAPVQADINMWTYWAQAERAMFRNCSADYTAITDWVDGVLANGTAEEVSDLKLNLLTAALSGPGWNNPANVTRAESDALQPADVGNYLMTPFNFYQSYGFERSVQPFCDTFQTFNQTDVLTTDNGGTALPIASEAGIAATYNITTAWSSFLTALSSVGYNSLPGNGLVDPSSEYSWSWQYCSQFGFYQVGNPANPHTIESRFVSLGSFQSGCNAMFANQPSLPAAPDVAAILKYGGWDMNPSNVMFTNGEYDPWRSLSVASTDTEIGAPGKLALPVPPACGAAPPNGTVFGITYKGQVHASDVRALFDVEDPYTQGFNLVGWPHSDEVEPFFAGLALFESALEQWLPCFVPKDC